MHAPSPSSAQKLFLWNFLGNFYGSTVLKGLLLVCASACYDKAVTGLVFKEQLRKFFCLSSYIFKKLGGGGCSKSKLFGE